MAQVSRAPAGVIWPDGLYPLQEVSKILGMAPKTFRQKYVVTGQCKVALFAKGSEMIPGYVVIRLAEELLECPEDQSEE